MTTKMVFFLNTLAEDADPGEYEKWVKEVDYPKARSLPSIARYEVVRIDGPLRDDPAPFDYLEIVEVADLDTYRSDLEGLPGRAEFVAQLRSFVGNAVAIHGTVID
jgi:hypothetical protein